MKLLKNNFYDIVKLYINQIGITIFSLILYTALGMIKDGVLITKIKVVLSLFATLFYFALLYNVAWEWGAKDKIRIDGGRMERSGGKGAHLALYANVPNFIVSLLAVITMTVYMLTSLEGFKSAYTLLTGIERIFMAMYLGTLQGVFIALESNTDLFFLLQSVGYIVMALLAVLVTHFGYSFGLAERRIFQTKRADQNGHK